MKPSKNTGFDSKIYEVLLRYGFARQTVGSYCNFVSSDHPKVCILQYRHAFGGSLRYYFTAMGFRDMDFIDHVRLESLIQETIVKGVILS